MLAKEKAMLKNKQTNLKASQVTIGSIQEAQLPAHVQEGYTHCEGWRDYD